MAHFLEPDAVIIKEGFLTQGVEGLAVGLLLPSWLANIVFIDRLHHRVTDVSRHRCHLVAFWV